MVGACRLRPATPADLSELARIERASFSDPWTATMLADSLAVDGVVALVAESPRGEIAGSVIGRVAADEGEIFTISVAPRARSRGLGRTLLDAAIAGMAERGARSVWLEVRKSNLTAQALYHSAGFCPVGVRRRFYSQPVEDALRMVIRLPASAGT